MKIGAQLYTVREFTKTLEDLDTTLGKIADIGYKVVQVSGTCAYEGEWMRDTLNKYGLTCAVTHSPADELINATEALVNKHNAFGCKYIGLGMCKTIHEDYESFRDTYKPVAEKIRDLGSRFMYHNHQIEFTKLPDGRNVFEHICEDFPADTLSFILDTYWVQFGGGDPAKMIRDMKGRMQCIHLKDLGVVGKEQQMRPVGEGNINFDAVIAAAYDANCEFALVEQDHTYGEDPFDCLARSYKYLNSLGLN